MMKKRTRFFMGTLSCGVILANLIVASSTAMGPYATFHISLDGLHLASLACGVLLGIMYEETLELFYGVGLMALTAVLLFSIALIVDAMLSSSTFLDVVALYAFQQSFPILAYICVLGGMGAFITSWLQLYID